MDIHTKLLSYENRPRVQIPCFQGRNVMMGYLNDEEKTNEVIDEEGFLHSGDLGIKVIN